MWCYIMGAVFGRQHLLYTWGEGGSYHTDFHLLRCFLTFSSAFKIWEGGMCRRWQLLLESRTIFVPNQARIGESISEKIKGNMHLFFLPTRSFSGIFSYFWLGRQSNIRLSMIADTRFRVIPKPGVRACKSSKTPCQFRPWWSHKISKNLKFISFQKTFIC